jgi:hypothetical protein
MLKRIAAVLVGTLVVGAGSTAVVAAPIPFTPSSGNGAEFSYSNAQSDFGLFGNPSLSGNTFTFAPTVFQASANPNTAATTSDRLSMTIKAQPNGVLSKITVDEFGDWSILGAIGGVKVTGGLFITDLTPGHAANTYSLTPTVQYYNSETNTTITSPARPTGESSGTWHASLFYNLLPLPGDVTSVQLVLNNVLQASAGTETTSFIQKKAVTLTVNDPVIPEPASLAVISVGGMVLFCRRRKA